MNKYMSASKIMRIVSILGIICLLALQWVWWRNAYRAVEANYIQDVQVCLKQATDKAITSYLDSTNTTMKFANKDEGERILKDLKPISKHTANNTLEIGYMLEEALTLDNHPLTENRINFHFNTYLKEKFGFVPNHNIQICRVPKLIDEKSGPRFNRVAIGKGQDTIYHQFGFMAYTVVTLPSPVQLYLKKGIFILVISILLVILIGTILVFQFISMQRDRKFASFIVEYTREMVHELKTPVSGIQMLLQMLQRDKFTNKAEKESYLIDGINMGKKIQLNIDNILYMAVTERKILPLYLLETDMRTFMESIVDSYRVQEFDSKNVRILTHYEPENFKCRMDAELMGNVIYNLMENAIKYTHVETLIEIFCSKVGNNVEIRVKDNGMGMSSVDQKRIFELFERGSAHRNRQYPGFGIGLHYVERVVKAHGGKVYVHSELGKGAEFTIRYASIVDFLLD